MKITFLGASGEVTGSCYCVEFNDGTKILVDGGYFQGHQEDLVRNGKELPIDLTSVKYLILTHGHLDHCGRVPVFYKQGFRGKIIATAPTRDIAEIIWRDNLNLLLHAKNLEQVEPFFSEDDIEGALALFTIVDYEQNIKLSNKVQATLCDAGHILGSATVKLIEGSDSLVFSGDLGNWPMGNVRVTVHPGPTDAVVMEATYGDRVHEDKAERKATLRKVIDKIKKNKSTLLIPAFAIERSQELLRDLDDLIEEEHMAPVPTFLDSPMAIQVTALFPKYKKFLNDDVRQQYDAGDDPFSFKFFEVTPSSHESKEINVVPGPKIIIAGSGMMTGGRVHHHLKRVLPDPRSILLVVGYQAEGTLGREIQSEKEAVYIDGKRVPVRCRIESMGAYSAHADKNKLLEWFEKFDPTPRNVFITHADPVVAANFSETLKEKYNTTVIVAKMNETATI